MHNFYPFPIGRRRRGRVGSAVVADATWLALAFMIGSGVKKEERKEAIELPNKGFIVSLHYGGPATTAWTATRDEK